MAGALKHHAWYSDERHVDAAAGLSLGRVSLGFVNAAGQPAWNEDRSLLAVMEGEVFDYEEWRRHLERAGHRFSGLSHAELLLHGFEARGRAFFAELDGAFAAAIWDAARGRLVLTNDRFGMKPVYYAKVPGKLLLSSEIKALLVDGDVPRTVNPRGVAQFFDFGHLLGEDTLLEGVRVLPPAGWLTYDAREGRSALGRYWRFGDVSPDGRLGKAEFRERVDETFKRAIDRRCEGGARLGISLSGGLDSRTILAAIDHGRVPIRSLSIGMRGSVDHQSAALMARLAGCSHHQYILDDCFLSRFEEHMDHMVHLTDGHYLCQCIVMPSLPVYRDLGIEVLLRGHAGELMHMDKAYNFSLDRDAWSIRDEAGLEAWLWRRLRPYMSSQFSKSLLSGPAGDRMDDLARESLRACIRESEGVDHPLARVSLLFITQRLRRETALSLVEFGSQVETRLPYLDNHLVDLLLAAPPEWRRGDAIQTHILRRRMPAFLNVINANTGVRVGAGSVPRFLGRARLKVLGKLGVPGYQPYERLGLWLRKELRPLVRDLLLNDRFLGRGIFNPATVRSIVEGHLDGGKNHTFLLLALMIFEKGQRRFVDGGAS
jgi:asparagine synthase (glutamine-hydrolysing)